MTWIKSVKAKSMLSREKTCMRSRSGKTNSKHFTNLSSKQKGQRVRERSMKRRGTARIVKDRLARDASKSRRSLARVIWSRLAKDELEFSRDKWKSVKER